MQNNLTAPFRLRCGRELPVSAFLAPLEGVMTPHFIKAADSLELLDVWMAPFMPVTPGAAPSKGAIRKRLAPFNEGGATLVAQILGKNPETNAVCAAHMVEAGIKFISLNAGCPSGEVLRSGSGGALLKNPTLFARIIDACLKAIDGRAALIVKLRSGWSNPKEMETLIPLVRDSGASAAILHFRTVEENYSPASGAQARIALAKSLAGDMPLIGNGDIRSPEDATAMLASTNCDGIAIGRGFMADPFLLRRILNRPAPPLDEGRKIFLEAMKAAGCKGKAKGNILELAKAMYGQESNTFKELL